MAFLTAAGRRGARSRVLVYDAHRRTALWFRRIVRL